MAVDSSVNSFVFKAFFFGGIVYSEQLSYIQFHVHSDHIEVERS